LSDQAAAFEDWKGRRPVFCPPPPCACDAARTEWRYLLGV